MAFQVNANVSALQVYNNLGVHQDKAAESLGRISSGLKAAGGGDIASAGNRRYLKCKRAGHCNRHRSGSKSDQRASGR